MNFVGLDIETTGFLEPGHRIVEVYAGIWSKEGKLLNEFFRIVNPQRSIPVEASRVHGYTSAMVAHAKPFADIASDLHAFLNSGDMFVWHNGDDFDGPFLDMEFGDAGLKLPSKPSFDTLRHGISCTPDGKKPNLGELCFAMDVEYDPALAHKAEYDVGVMMKSFFNGMNYGYFDA